MGSANVEPYMPILNKALISVVYSCDHTTTMEALKASKQALEAQLEGVNKQLAEYNQSNKAKADAIIAHATPTRLYDVWHIYHKGLGYVYFVTKSVGEKYVKTHNLTGSDTSLAFSYITEHRLREYVASGNMYDE